MRCVFEEGEAYRNLASFYCSVFFPKHKLLVPRIHGTRYGSRHPHVPFTSPWLTFQDGGGLETMFTVGPRLFLLHCSLYAAAPGLRNSRGLVCKCPSGRREVLPVTPGGPEGGGSWNVRECGSSACSPGRGRGEDWCRARSLGSLSGREGSWGPTDQSSWHPLP